MKDNALNRITVYEYDMANRPARTTQLDSNGWNLQALIAFALGVLPCLPGYLAVSGVVDKAGMPAIWLSLFDSGWFFSLAVAGTYYYLTAKKK